MKLTKTEQLENLLKKWRKEQENRGKNFHKYFAKDGIINEEKYKKILFILKEPNILKQLNSDEYKIDNQLGFYREFFDNNNFTCNENNELIASRKQIISKEFAKHKAYYYFFDNIPVKQKEKIARIAEYIINKNITDDYETLRDALEQVAIMNFNKSGGDSISDKRYFLEYCERFSDLICEEINILDPDIIVLIGGKSYINQLEQNNDNIKEILRRSNRKVVKLVHTSARGKALTINENEREMLKSIFKNSRYVERDLDCLYRELVVTDKSRLHLKYDRNVFKYFLKFVVNY